MSLLTEEKLVDFFKSGKFCEIFGHTMESMGKSYTTPSIQIKDHQGLWKEVFFQEVIETNSQQCTFCHYRTVYTKGEKNWRTIKKGGLKDW